MSATLKFCDSGYFSVTVDGALTSSWSLWARLKILWLVLLRCDAIVLAIVGASAYSWSHNVIVSFWDPKFSDSCYFCATLLTSLLSVPRSILDPSTWDPKFCDSCYHICCCRRCRTSTAKKWTNRNWARAIPINLASGACRSTSWRRRLALYDPSVVNDDRVSTEITNRFAPGVDVVNIRVFFVLRRF